MEVYLDNSATTKPSEEVVKVMMQALTKFYGNPSSLHRKGLEVEKLIKTARHEVAKSFYANDQEIIFTSGGTECNNMAIKGAIEARKRRGKRIITTKIEHPSVLNVYDDLSKQGYDVKYIGVDSFGGVNIDEFKEYLTSETILVSMMHVNNEVGTIQPIEKIGKILKESNFSTKPLFHVDAIQSFGKIPFNPKKIHSDLVSISGHKIHGPKGIGALYKVKNLHIKPLLQGGNQEVGMRSGTENVPGILGLGQACKEINEHLDEKIQNIYKAKKRFIDLVKNEIHDIKINGYEEDGSAPHIVNISFLGVRGEVLLHTLEQENIYVSTGSACSSNKHSQSHVLKAMNLSNEAIEGAIRFSFCENHTIDEIDYAVDKLKKHITYLRKIIKR